MELVGWLGAIMLGICALPQAIQSYRTRSSKGVSLLFLLLWGGGEILTLIYIGGTTMQLPLILNYIFNLICLAVIIYFWVFPASSS
jgi:uncharacterized protein with PQ loop repeat